MCAPAVLVIPVGAGRALGDIAAVLDRVFAQAELAVVLVLSAIDSEVLRLVAPFSVHRALTGGTFVHCPRLNDLRCPSRLAVVGRLVVQISLVIDREDGLHGAVEDAVCVGDFPAVVVGLEESGTMLVADRAYLIGVDIEDC